MLLFLLCVLFSSCLAGSTSHIQIPFPFLHSLLFFLHSSIGSLSFCFVSCLIVCFLGIWISWFSFLSIDHFTQHWYKCNLLWTVTNYPSPNIGHSKYCGHCQENQVMSIHPRYGFYWKSRFLSSIDRHWR